MSKAHAIEGSVKCSCSKSRNVLHYKAREGQAAFDVKGEQGGGPHGCRELDNGRDPAVAGPGLSSG